MFAGDSESEFSFDPHVEVRPTQLQGDANKTNRARDDLLAHQIITQEELEFGWSANLSGIKGLTEQQARRILCFERSLREYLLSNSSADAREPTFDEQHRRLCSAQPPRITLTDDPHDSSPFSTGLEAFSSRYCRGTETRSPLNSAFLSARPSLPEYRRLASSKLNKSLRISSSQSSFLSFRNLRKSKSRTSNTTSDSDEFLYLLAKKRVVNSPVESSERSIIDSSLSEKNNTASVPTVNGETGLRGFVSKISRALVRPNSGPSSLKKLEIQSTIQEDDPILCNLSHDMVGAASPFPMRRPLNLGGGNLSAPVEGDWIGVSRGACPEYRR